MMNFRIIKLTLLSLLLVSFAHAEQVELGSFPIVPCTRIKEGILMSAPHRVFLTMSYDNISKKEIRQNVKKCAIESAIAAGIVAIGTKGIGVGPTFYASLVACLQSDIGELLTNVHLRSHGECYWEEATYYNDNEIELFN